MAGAINRAFGRSSAMSLMVIVPLVLSAALQAVEIESPHQKLVKGKGVAFVKLLIENKFAEAEALYDPAMQKALPAGKLAQIWKQVKTQVGSLKKQGAVRYQRYQQFDIALVECQFEKMSLDVKLVFDSQQRVSGLFFLPATAAAYQPPAYVNRELFSETQVTVGKKPWQLPATLSMPKGNGPWPVVVLVHGSGPQDRDETIGPSKVFRDLAWGLCSKGIAVLRYEKRTKAHQLAMASLVNTLTIKEEVVDDVLEATSLLRSQKGIDPNRVYVLGHSLGGMLAPHIATRDKHLAGLVILAGPSRPLEDLIVEQVTYIFSVDGQVTDKEKAQLDVIKKQVTQVKTVTPETDRSKLPLGLPAAYWISLSKIKPAQTAAQLDLPMLILQGGRDYQVVQKDFDGWAQVLKDREDVKIKLYEKLNHLFISGDGPSTPDEYMKPGHVDPQVIKDIAEWVNETAP